ncbi:hypothetical protein RhiirC2_846135 [Rhizophagus irregularis]|uniref:Uncharacterized protein n=1 Tax=Rhizophagus irregularis TaxID=588596 RepID=A0A2N1NN54_9GLOM|nr:hypothetical protein RhiirC2_846135 [Rhizophagus irregularis]
MDSLDNTRLIGCYTDDRIDRIDQIIWSNPRERLRSFFSSEFGLNGLGRSLYFVFLGNTFLELDFGLKISASRVLWDIGFRLPVSLGYWISASWVLWILDFGFLSSLGY